jgi:hypothetical protein
MALCLYELDIRPDALCCAQAVPLEGARRKSERCPGASDRAPRRIKESRRYGRVARHGCTLGLHVLHSRARVVDVYRKCAFISMHTNMTFKG